MIRDARAAFAIVAALSLSACLDVNFDPASIVAGPRILGIQANPPEALFGEDVRFRVLALDATGADLTARDDVRVEWTVCLSIEQILRASGFTGSSGFAAGCSPEETLVLAHDGAPGRAILPGELLLDVVTRIPMTPPDEPIVDPMIPGIDPEALSNLATIIAEVGVPLAVRVEIYRGEELLANAFKRFAITTRSGATLNPPPPRFSIGEREVSARRIEAPHDCVSADGAPATVIAGGEVTLAPDPNEDPWLETYPVFDLGGRIIENQESAYYSWFSTAGGFSRGVTRRPDRDVTWRAPAEPGTYPLWVVVRDGHLGTSWCRADVVVNAP